MPLTCIRLSHEDSINAARQNLNNIVEIPGKLLLYWSF